MHMSHGRGSLLVPRPRGCDPRPHTPGDDLVPVPPPQVVLAPRGAACSLMGSPSSPGPSQLTGSGGLWDNQATVSGLCSITNSPAGALPGSLLPVPGVLVTVVALPGELGCCFQGPGCLQWVLVVLSLLRVWALLTQHPLPLLVDGTSVASRGHTLDSVTDHPTAVKGGPVDWGPRGCGPSAGGATGVCGATLQSCMGLRAWPTSSHQPWTSRNSKGSIWQCQTTLMSLGQVHPAAGSLPWGLITGDREPASGQTRAGFGGQFVREAPLHLGGWGLGSGKVWVPQGQDRERPRRAHFQM